MTMGQPLVVSRLIGHRGAAAHAPENTLAGLRLAAELGVRWVEFDVRVTADRRVVLIHDATLGRTTDGRGPVSRASYETIRRLDAGAWFAPRFAGERVPELGAALALVAQLGLGANIEIKSTRGRGAMIAGAVLAELVRIAPDPGRVLVSSFDRAALSAIAAADRRWPLGLLLRRPPRTWPALARRLGVRTLNCEQSHLTPRLVAALKSAGLPLVAFTVNDPVRARDLYRWGVDALLTDDPPAIAAAI